MIFSSPSTLIVLCLVAFSSWTSAHTVITYPGWRGNNLRNSSSATASNGLGVYANSGFTQDDGLAYPYGMQWIYPCTNIRIFPFFCAFAVLAFAVLTDVKKVEDYRFRKIAPSGPSRAAPSVFNQAGSAVTPRPFSTSTWAMATSRQIIHYRWYPSSKSQGHQTSCIQGAFALVRCRCRQTIPLWLETMPPFK